MHHSLLTGFVESLCLVMATASPLYWVFCFTRDNRGINILETWIYFKWQPPLATRIAVCFHCWVICCAAFQVESQLSGYCCAHIAVSVKLELFQSSVMYRTIWMPFLYNRPFLPGVFSFPKVSDGKLGAQISQGLFPAAFVNPDSEAYWTLGWLKPK